MYSNCQFCSTQIEEHKLASHEYYCQRNIIKCDRCEEFYDINLKQLHDEEYHQVQQCHACKKQVQDSKKHICSNKQIVCEYCQQQMLSGEYQKHEKTCGSRPLRCNYCFEYIMMRDILYHQKNCPALRANKQDQRQKNITIQKIQKNEINKLYSNQGSNYSQDSAQAQQSQQQLIQQLIGLEHSIQDSEVSKYIQDKKQIQHYEYWMAQQLLNANMEQMQMQKHMKDSKNKPVYSQGPNASQTSNYDYFRQEIDYQQNTPENQLLHQQFQQNQHNQNQNLKIMDYQQNLSQKVQNPSGTNFQQPFALEQQFNDNSIMGYPKMDIGLKNQIQYDQNKQMQSQQMKQDNEKKRIFENRNSQNKDVKNSIKDSDYSDSIIGRILLESIQADQLQMSYAQYKQHQKLQKEIETRRQQQPQPNIINQNQASSIDTEFYYLSDQEKIQQRLLMELIQQNKRN